MTDHAALEAARRDALEEAAKVAEADYTPGYGPHRDSMEWLAERQRTNIAERIRALLATTQEGGGELGVPPLRSGADPGVRKMEGLKPCPFCGGPATVESVTGGIGLSWTVGCNDGDAEQLCYGYQSLTTFARKSDAIAAWNRRPSATGDEAGEKDGFVVVPREPTEDMVERGRAALSQGDAKVQTHARVLWVWSAMIDAALAQSRTPASQGEVRTEDGPGGPATSAKGKWR